ncbi:MAG: 16S rRNA (cytosine(1402)-N(4))-methyltransferase RsmH [Chloroflexota bacterium]
MPEVHIPVLVKETLEALAVQPGGRYIDGTLGTGGHAAAILERSSPGGQLLGIDADPEAINIARGKLATFGDSAILVNDNFANLNAICFKYDFVPVHGILFDLGLSSLELGSSRGFSFQTDAPLDMRFDPNQKTTAGEIVNTYSEAELAHLLRTYGEESLSQPIARRIVQERPIRTTLQLARLIERVAGHRRGRINPATRTFQALRIAVNNELEHLKTALKQAVGLLGYRGRLVVISYHSLEDRIVKQFMHEESRDCICPPGAPVCTCGHQAALRLVNKRVITPTPDEINLNPRCRSAKLRAAESLSIPEEHFQIVEKLCSLSAVETNGWRRPILLRRLKEAFSAV